MSILTQVSELLLQSYIPKNLVDVKNAEEDAQRIASGKDTGDLLYKTITGLKHAVPNTQPSLRDGEQRQESSRIEDSCVISDSKSSLAEGDDAESQSDQDEDSATDPEEDEDSSSGSETGSPVDKKAARKEARKENKKKVKEEKKEARKNKVPKAVKKRKQKMAKARKTR